MAETRDFRLPDLGEGLADAEIVRWLVAVGDRVAVDQPVAEMSTAKAEVQVPTPFGGVVVARHGEAGDTIAVGSPLISIEVADAEPAAPGAAAPAAGSGNLLVGYGTAASPGRRRRVLLDGEPAAGATLPASAPGEVRTVLRGARRLTAERLARSHAEAPAASAWLTAEATRLLEVRTLMAARSPDLHLTPLAVLLRLCVVALRRFPLLNARYDEASGEVVMPSAIHLGVAAQTDRGLLVPVIHDAQDMTTLALATELGRLSAAARDGSVDAASLAGSTFTVSNFGAFGVDGGIAIINPPEAAILGVGAISRRPWVVGEAVAPRPVVQLTLVFDHRVCDGGDAAGFLRLLGDLVENPEPALEWDPAPR
jgi:2-oxoisovalerate dehydrogenase E2 component (dihydrolipoyl transacylase)